MFNFKKFPAKLKYEQWNNEDEVILEREVEVFGRIEAKPTRKDSMELPQHLIAYRETDTDSPIVFLLPYTEFEERFKDYVLVDE